MAFIMKKKRFKFHVDFEIEELSSVPYVSGVLFLKLRLLDGGSFVEFSTREEVFDHVVRWKAHYKFVCKMTANPNTGILEPCICRVSVRKELKGGKSFQKLGYADVNMAEFAGAGCMSRRYLLEGYDSKRRQDNSTLKININMTLMSGDPCFKVPTVQQVALPGDVIEELHPDNKGASEEVSEGSIKSGSSGFSSLPRKRTSRSTDMDPNKDSPSFEPHHSRNASGASNLSRVSGQSGSVPFIISSRHSSSSEAMSGHSRNPSYGSAADEHLKGSLTRQHKRLEPATNPEKRLSSTRVDTDELIDELIKNTDFQHDDSAEASGLQLFVATDGSTALGSRQVQNHVSSRKFERVVFDHR